MMAVFLKSVHFLGPDLTKCIMSGVCKTRRNSVGVVIKDHKGCVYTTFCHFVSRFNEVTLAFERKHKFVINTDSRESVKVNSVFG